MAKQADRYFEVDPWQVVEQGFDPAHNRVAESIFSLGNEYMGVRGYADERSSVDSLRGSYFNGLYEMDYSVPRSYRGIVDKTHFMVNAADWLSTSIYADGEKLDLSACRISRFERRLSMREGTLVRRFQWDTVSGKSLSLRFSRFLSMDDVHRAYQRIEIASLSGTCQLEITCGIDFDAYHESMGRCFWHEEARKVLADGCAMVGGTEYSRQLLFSGFRLDVSSSLYGSQAEALAEMRFTPSPEGLSECRSEVRTEIQPEIRQEVQSSSLFGSSPSSSLADSQSAFQYEDVTDLPLYVGKRITATISPGQDLRIDKTVVNVAGTQQPLDPVAILNEGLERLSLSGNDGYDTALEHQKLFWQDYWNAADIEILGANRVADQQGIRFSMFQLAQTYRGKSQFHNIGAKGLTGEFYNGHAFWDTESYCLPYYLFTDPSAARALLSFRYHTLAQARARAAMLDCEGACYPVATLNGDEACTLWQHANLQFQTDTAIAYAIRHYVTMTGDIEFLQEQGISMLVEICRFLVSRGGYDPRTGRFGYYGVMGPDEFHMMVNNDCYTNCMAKKTFEYTVEVLETMRREASEAYSALSRQLGLTETEVLSWRGYAQSMYVPYDEHTHVYEQFSGYYSCPHIDVDSIPVEQFPLYHSWSYDRIYRTDMIKQPSVLMLLFLYNSSFPLEDKRANYEFYEPRTIHESSLSPSVHSILACELGKWDDAMRFFSYATRLDLDNYNRNADEGLHMTSLAAAWMNIVYGFCGMRSDDGRLCFNPTLPPSWEGYRFKLVCQDSVLLVSVDAQGAGFIVLQGPPVEIFVRGEALSIGSRTVRVGV